MGGKETHDTPAFFRLRRYVALGAEPDVDTDRDVTRDLVNVLRIRAGSAIASRLGEIKAGGGEGVAPTPGDAALLLCIWDYLHEQGLNQDPSTLSDTRLQGDVERANRVELERRIDAIRPMADQSVQSYQSEQDDRELAACLMRDSEFRLVLTCQGDHAESTDAKNLRKEVADLLMGRSWISHNYRTLIESYDAITRPGLTAREQRELAEARAKVQELERKAAERKAAG